MSSISFHTPWQCELHNSKSRDNALYLNERLSDLTITFPFHNISFPTHRLMMAKTSPYFENLFYGPMAMHGQEWKVKDNEVEPEVFKVVLAHCYDVNLLRKGWEIILEVYKLADCYMIDSLKFLCLEHLKNAISNDNNIDFKLILEWSTRYCFSDVEDAVFEILALKSNHAEFSSWGLPLDENIFKNISNLLLDLPLEKHANLLSQCEHLDLLMFEESWRHPENILSNELLISIFEGSQCKNTCRNDYSSLKGCIPPEAFSHFININRLHSHLCKDVHQLHAYLSLNDVSHSQAIFECIKKNGYDTDEFRLYMNIHIPCNRISPEHLAIWASNIMYLEKIYISEIDDQSVSWAVATIISLECRYVNLPGSTLSLNGFKTFVRNVDSAKADVDCIEICSCYIRRECMEELNTLTEIQIEVNEFDEDLHYW